MGGAGLPAGAPPVGAGVTLGGAGVVGSGPPASGAVTLGALVGTLRTVPLSGVIGLGLAATPGLAGAGSLLQPMLTTRSSKLSMNRSASGPPGRRSPARFARRLPPAVFLHLCRNPSLADRQAAPRPRPRFPTGDTISIYETHKGGQMA